MEKRYKLTELTLNNKCVIASCPGVYEIKELTSKDCSIGFGCPGVYEITPKDMECGPIGGCPSIEEAKDEYLIIGKKRNPNDFGLEKKVGKDEVFSGLPKEILEGMVKKRISEGFYDSLVRERMKNLV